MINRDKGREVEEDSQQVQNYFTFFYHTSFLLFRNLQWDGTRSQEKGKGHVQGRKGVDTDEGKTSGRRLSTGIEFVYHTSFLLFRNTQWDGTRMQEKDKGHV